MPLPAETIPPVAPAGGEPCPTPLEWRVVLEEFRCGRRPFESVDAVTGERVRGVTFGEGPPLYVVGPAPGDAELFALLAWLLREHRCCVFVEPPDIGWPVRSVEELPRQSGALLAAASHLGHERFAVFGVGFGSAAALDLCLNEPARVSALALVQGTARLELTWLERGLHRYGAMLPGTIGRIPGWRGMQVQNHMPWFPPFDGSRFDFLVDDLARTPTAQLSRRMLMWGDLDFRPQLRSITAPIMLIETEGLGRGSVGALNELQTGLPQAQVESLHSAGLHPYLTHPHRVAKLLRTFLETVNPPREERAESVTTVAVGPAS